MSDAGTGSTTTPTTKKRRPLRWFWRTLAVLGVGTVLLIALLPMLLSGGWGRAQVQSVTNQNIQGSVELTRLNLRWFGKQEVGGFALKDPAGGKVMTFDALTIDTSLWSLLTGSAKLIEVDLAGLVVDVVADENGETNLQRAVASKDGKAGATAGGGGGGEQQPAGERQAVPVALKFNAPDAKINVTQPGLDPVHAVLSTLLSVDAEKLEMTVEGTASQGDAVGRIDIKANATELTAAEPLYNVIANITDLPMAGLEPFAGNRGLLVEALGEKLNLNITANNDPATGHQHITVIAKAKRLDANAKSTIADGTATANGKVDLVATSALVQLFAPDEGPLASVRLAGDVPITLNLESLTAPAGAFDPTKVAVTANVRIADGSATGDDTLGTMAWSNTFASVESANLQERITLTARSDLNVGGRDGKFIANAAAKKLFDDAGGVAVEQAEADGTIEWTGLPVAWVDGIAGLDGMVVDALGAILGAKVVVAAEPDAPMTVTIDANSANLTAEQVRLVVRDDRIDLTNPAAVRFAVQPALTKRFVPEGAGVSFAEAVMLKLDELSVPMPAGDARDAGDAGFDLAAAKLKAGVVTGAIDVTGIEAIGDARLASPTITIAGTLGALDIDVDATLEQAPGGGAVAAVTGAPATTVAIDVRQLNPFGEQPEAKSITVTAVGGEFNTQLDLAMTGGMITLTQPGRIALPASAATMAHFGLAGEGMPTLAKPIVLTLAPTKLSAPLAFALDKLRFAATVSATPIELAGDANLTGTTMTGLAGDVSINGGESVTARLGAATRVPGAKQDGTLSVDANLNNWLDADGQPAPLGATGKATVTLKDLPSAFVAAVSGQAALPDVMGETVAVSVVYEAPKPEAGTLVVDAKSANLAADGAFVLADNKLAATRPLNVRWTLTPAAYAKLTAPAPPTDGSPPPPPSTLVLAEPATFKVAVTNLSDIPLSGAFDSRHLAIDATLAAGDIKLRDTKTGAVATLAGTSGTLKAGPLGGGVTAKLAAKVGYTDPTITEPATGDLTLDAALSDLFNDDAQFDTNAMTAKVTAQVNNTPVVALDQLGKADGQLLALLGRSANARVVADIKQGAGPVLITMASPNANARIPALYTAAGVTLTEDAVITAKVTPELGKKLLKKLNFILESASTADQPIKLTIPKAGFFVPVPDFDLAKATAKNVKLELGTIELANSGLLPLVLKLLRRDNPRQMTAQFTPLIVSLENGVVDHNKRLDLLLDGSLPLVTFGKTDLVNEQLDLVIGMPEQLLDKVFDIENLPKDAVMQIPVTGALSDPKIDIGAAAANIATLKATSGELGKQLTKLSDNPLLRALLEGLIKDLQKDLNKSLGGKPVPLKSQDPLPWAATATDPAPMPVPGEDQPAPSAADAPPAAEPAPAPAPEKPKEKPIEEQLIEEGLKRLFN